MGWLPEPPSVRRVMGFAGILLMLGVAASAFAEEVTLTTYYPSPRGVYEELRTTDNTFLATAAGSVGIGMTAPAAKLSVRGDGTGVANIGGGFCGGNYTGISLNGLIGSCGVYNILSSPTDRNLFLNRPTGSQILFRENRNKNR